MRFSIHMYNPGLIWQFFKLDFSKSRSSLKPAATRGSGYVPSWDGKLTLLALSPQIPGDGNQCLHCDSTLPEIITKTLHVNLLNIPCFFQSREQPGSFDKILASPLPFLYNVFQGALVWFSLSRMMISIKFFQQANDVSI